MVVGWWTVSGLTHDKCHSICSSLWISVILWVGLYILIYPVNILFHICILNMTQFHVSSCYYIFLCSLPKTEVMIHIFHSDLTVSAHQATTFCHLMEGHSKCFPTNKSKCSMREGTDWGKKILGWLFNCFYEDGICFFGREQLGDLWGKNDAWTDAFSLAYFYVNS